MVEATEWSATRCEFSSTNNSSLNKYSGCALCIDTARRVIMLLAAGQQSDQRAGVCTSELRSRGRVSRSHWVVYETRQSSGLVTLRQACCQVNPFICGSQWDFAPCVAPTSPLRMLFTSQFGSLR